MITSIRSAVLSSIVFATLALASVPAVASAQTATCGWFWGQNLSACGTGTVLTYLQVINQNGTTYTPGNFIVQMSGQNPSLPSFPGSLNGVMNSLTAGGTYTITVPQTLGFVPSYSQGCTGTVVANQQSTCVITMTIDPQYAAPVPYPYPYNLSVLTCTPQYQSTVAGRTTTFVALGGMGSYSWTTVGNTFLNTGAVLNTTFGSTGTQSVVVNSGSQTATCTVNVSANGPIVYSGSNSTPYTTVYGTTYAASQYTKLPNTGFAPVDSTTAAFATAILLAVGVVFLPYVKKSFAIIAR